MQVDTVYGWWHLPRNTLVTDSLHLNPVTEGKTCIELTVHTDKQNFAVEHRGLLRFLCTWNEIGLGLDTTEVLTVYLQPQM
jgi:hypothetical protein